MVFLLWAPAFCVGEEYAKRILPVKAKDEEESLDFEEQMIRKARHYFTYMSIWELGLSRSTRFSGKHLQPALAITLLIFSSALIPGAVVSLVVPGVWSFAGELLGIVLSSFTSVFALATLAWTFLLLLPAGARKELGIEPEIDLNASLDLASRKVVRFEGQSLKFAFLIVISAIAGWLLLEEAKVRTAMPKSVSATLLSAESTTADYVVSFRLEDSKDEFRWLIPYNFRLKLFSPADAEKEAPVSLPKLDLLSQLGGLGDDTFLRPTRVDIFDADGRVLSPESVSPLYRPIKLVLFYQIPPNLPERGRFELHYMSLIRAEQPVLAGDYHIPGGHAADLKK